MNVNGMWKSLCLQFAHDFQRFEVVDRKSHGIVSNLIAFIKELHLDLEKVFNELLATRVEELFNSNLMEL